MGQKRRVSPLPQLCLGKCPVWTWSGELAVEQPLVAGMKQAEGVYCPHSPSYLEGAPRDPFPWRYSSPPL